LTFSPGDVDFDGVDFSSVIHVNKSNDKTQSVEFFFPVRMMRSFASYDYTGQQLINTGIVAHQRRTLPARPATRRRQELIRADAVPPDARTDHLHLTSR